MPVRDTDFFLYPTDYKPKNMGNMLSVAMNRGASGIDGILSSSMGYAEGTGIYTSLLIGDLATIYDLNSFHNLVRYKTTSSSSGQTFQLTTTIVNNDGGAIFSFLPIAGHGSDVYFEEFFGTPTNAFSFSRGIEAFGLPVKSVSSYESFKSEYNNAIVDHQHRVIEARVVTRESNVKVHSKISKQAINFLESHITSASTISGITFESKLAIKTYGKVEIDNSIEHETSFTSSRPEKILVLLHGWMGEKEDWDEIGLYLTDQLSAWRIVSVDLPGHGDSTRTSNALHKSLGVADYMNASIEDVAIAIIQSLRRDHGVQRIDAICGYSMGGRLLMEMNRLCSLGGTSAFQDLDLINPDTKKILISTYPGMSSSPNGSETRLLKDYELASQMFRLDQKLHLSWINNSDETHYWIPFLDKRYDADI